MKGGCIKSICNNFLQTIDTSQKFSKTIPGDFVSLFSADTVFHLTLSVTFSHTSMMSFQDRF